MRLKEAIPKFFMFKRQIYGRITLQIYVYFVLKTMPPKDMKTGKKITPTYIQIYTTFNMYIFF